MRLAWGILDRKARRACFSSVVSELTRPLSSRDNTARKATAHSDPNITAILLKTLGTTRQQQIMETTMGSLLNCLLQPAASQWWFIMAVLHYTVNGFPTNGHDKEREREQKIKKGERKREILFGRVRGRGFVRESITRPQK